MEGCEKWKRRGTYRRRSLRQALFARFMLKHEFRGETSKPWRLRCLHSLAAAAVSDDREGEKSRAQAPTSRVKSKKEGKSYSQIPLLQGPAVAGIQDLAESAFAPPSFALSRSSGAC